MDNVLRSIEQLVQSQHQMKQDLQRIATPLAQGHSALSVERAAYNISMSIQAFGEKMKLAILWGSVILGMTVVVAGGLLTIILKG